MKPLGTTFVVSYPPATNSTSTTWSIFRYRVAEYVQYQQSRNPDDWKWGERLEVLSHWEKPFLGYIYGE